MKNQKKILMFLFVLCFIVLIFPSDTRAATKNPKINISSVNMYEGESVQLKVKNTSDTWKWSSSNKKVATVNKNGKVIAVKSGKCTITAKYNNKKITCKVTVLEEKEIDLEYVLSCLESEKVVSGNKYQMAAEYIGAEEGYKYKYMNIPVEVYKYDVNSDAWKSVEKTGNITIQYFGDFSAEAYSNGYVLLCDKPSEKLITTFYNIFK